jgi:hypothetical protein
MGVQYVTPWEPWMTVAGSEEYFPYYVEHVCRYEVTVPWKKRWKQ